MSPKEIHNLDDMSQYFFQIARMIGHPLKDIKLELTDTWGNQTKNLK